MVRRGSTVRVRQRALQKRRTSALCVHVDLRVQPRAVGMEPIMELSRRRGALCRSGAVCSGARSSTAPALLLCQGGARFEGVEDGAGELSFEAADRFAARFAL